MINRRHAMLLLGVSALGLSGAGRASAAGEGTKAPYTGLGDPMFSQPYIDLDDAKTPFTRANNLGRVRVVVT